MKATKIKNTILLNRSLYEWDFYKDTNTFKLFIHLLLRASWKDEPKKVIPLKRGQLLTSLNNLSYETGLSLTSTRTSITKLTVTGSITSKSTNKYRIITVLKYDTYQLNSNQTNKPKRSPATGKLAPSNQFNPINQFNQDNLKDIPYQEIIDYLNKKIDAHYRYSTKSIQDKIKARLNNGATYEDFVKVIDIKYNEWNNTDMAKFLRPSTLFGTKFEEYLNQKSNVKKEEDKPLDYYLGINEYEKGAN